ncbi:MAG: UDP-N-acetylmuramoyl-L-alanine--D-glutamate ligase [bacterium]
MDLERLLGKKIAILGLGAEGLSLAKFLYKHNITNISVCDQRNLDGFSDIVKQIPGKPELFLGKDYLKKLSRFDFCFRSPGIPSNLPEIQELKKNHKLSSPTNLFFELCPAKIIGITGTKGKGTTATALYNILKLAKKDVFLVGNIGKPALDTLSEINSKSIVIFELSSFQLEDIKASPHIAVFLNLFKDHLDHHLDMREYQDSKLRIFEFQKSTDWAIIHFLYKDLLKNQSIKSKKLYCGNNINSSATATKKQLTIKLNSTKHIFSTSNIKLLGVHNYLNLAVAGLIAKILNTDNLYIQKTIDNFKGLEHRLELVREYKGVKYYNDSIATVPESTIAAINAFKNPKILILGGSDKGADYSELAKSIGKQEIKAIILIGETANKIKNSLKNTKNVKIILATSLEQAVEKANSIACFGDILLLSPACASFDMFSGYKQRGEQFKKIVNTLQ